MSFEIKEPVVAYNRPNSIQEFLDFVEPLQAKYEWFDGEPIMMAGSTQGHVIIRDNINSCLKTELKDRGCRSFQETIYLKMKDEDKMLFLPDVIVTCDTQDLNLKSRFVEYPSIIVEILSESTECVDRGEKWAQYRKIPSLKYYIMVSQDKPLIELYGRPHPQSLFYYETFEGLDARVELREMDISIPMRKIYEGILFQPEEAKV